jgi:Calx-beta domain
LSFPVALSATAAQVVTVDYATADGNATSPSDYAAASDKLTFQPGEKVKPIAIGVVGDTAIEPAETFSVRISTPANAAIADGTATGTITNDDTAVPVTAGFYRGHTQNGNYVFSPSRPVGRSPRSGSTTSLARVTALCGSPGARTSATARSRSTRTEASAQGDWSGSEVNGDVEWTHWDAKVTGLFSSPTAVAGTIIENYELNDKGRHYRCTTGEVSWSATLQT